MQTVELSKDLVLVGGGHSHALALGRLAMRPVAGLRITLISPSSHTPYSGMLPGLIAGHYRFEETHIDLARLCQWAGVRFITGEVTGIDPVGRRLSLKGRPDIAYDVVSLDIGSQPELDSVPGAREFSIPVKPVAGLWQRWRQLETRLADGSLPAGARIAVVGGGAGSVELALAMAERLGERVQIDLYTAGDEILEHYNYTARQAVNDAFGDKAVTVHLHARVVEVSDGLLTLEGGEAGPFDALFWCTGASAAPWIGACGLPTDKQGFLAVNEYLQSPADERVFAAGDIATQMHDPRPKAGVYAVRQAPVLAHNLCASLLGESLRRYRPQRRFLSLLSLGEKRATADRGVFSATGKWVWRWKNYIDKTFMRRFSDLALMAGVPSRTLTELPKNPQPVCGGCGAKVGGDALAGALAKISAEFPGLSANTVEDASPLPPVAGDLFQSVDVLREIVSDPWLMGRIAANHALSDLYACGLKPLSALAVATLPYASGNMLERELYQLLAGAMAEFAPHDCLLAGGHSMQGYELQLGFVVNGTPLRAGVGPLSKNGAAPGDALILTQALGTGALFAAHMQLAADGRDIDGAIASMLHSSSTAAELALAFDASACTDVTGFGLAGHLTEMLGDRLSARIALQSIPLLDGVEDALRKGLASSMQPSNVASFGAGVTMVPGADGPLANILFDPQTSGGLLIAVPAEQAQALCSALVDSGYERAAVIGEICARTEAATIELH